MSITLTTIPNAVILDVDGVIVGEKIGVNSPHPHEEVMQALGLVRERGIPIVLCTAKPHFAIRDIIEGARLNNPHITEGGAVIIDPIDNTIVEKHVIENAVAKEAAQAYLAKKVYTEIYTIDNYYVQKNQTSFITERHAHILQAKPVIADSLVRECEEREVVKIMPIATDEHDKERLIEIFKPFETKLTLQWGIHPVALPLQFGIITAKGVSKKSAAIAVSRSLQIPLENTLGVGDSLSDWQFIELTGFGAAMGNANDELKKLVLSKGNEHSCVGPAVDENEILDIFEYFLKNNNP